MKNKIINRLLIAVAIFICWLQVPIGLHIKETLPAVAPTCINSGLTEGRRCVLCRKILRAQEVIPATDVHAYDTDFDTGCNTCSNTREVDNSFKFVNYRVSLVDENKNHKNLRAVVYKLGDKTVEDPTDEDALEAIDETAQTYWGKSEINRILLTDAGNYVVMLKYNVGNSAAFRVPMVLGVSADPKLLIDGNNRIMVVDENATNTNHTVTVYYLNDAKVENPYDEAAVKHIAVDSLTYSGLVDINNAEIVKGGNYVLYLSYEMSTGVKRTLVLNTTVTERPAIYLDEENRLFIECSDPAIINPRVYIYHLGDKTVDNIYDENALMEIATPSQLWGEKVIAKTQLTDPGNYVLHLHYNIGTGERMTVAIKVAIE